MFYKFVYRITAATDSFSTIPRKCFRVLRVQMSKITRILLEVAFSNFYGCVGCLFTVAPTMDTYKAHRKHIHVTTHAHFPTDYATGLLHQDVRLRVQSLCKNLIRPDDGLRQNSHLKIIHRHLFIDYWSSSCYLTDDNSSTLNTSFCNIINLFFYIVRANIDGNAYSACSAEKT